MNKETAKDKQGYVYILSSKNCECIKIGGTDYPPIKRIKEINATEPYKSLGEWHLVDFRQVTDWRKVEHYLHYAFRSFLNKTIPHQKELFFLSEKTASEALNNLEDEIVINKPKVDRMFNDINFRNYLSGLMKLSGLTHWLDYQGCWTLTLFPSTGTGRYFTLNIGKHEVAYSTLEKNTKPSTHMLLVDKLILDNEFSEIHQWLKKHNGDIFDNEYTSATNRAVIILFEGTFSDCFEFLGLDGARLALIAYWHNELLKMAENNKLSSYSRFHNYNAVAKLNRYI